MFNIRSTVESGLKAHGKQQTITGDKEYTEKLLTYKSDAAYVTGGSKI